MLFVEYLWVQSVNGLLHQFTILFPFSFGRRAMFKFSSKFFRSECLIQHRQRHFAWRIRQISNFMLWLLVRCCWRTLIFVFLLTSNKCEVTLKCLCECLSDLADGCWLIWLLMSMFCLSTLRSIEVGDLWFPNCSEQSLSYSKWEWF